MATFAAIDFETANQSPDSACAVAIVLVADGTIIHRESHLIRPPTPDFEFTHVHGLAWDDVAKAEAFPAVWGRLQDRVRDIDFFVAHNAPFDRGVLAACCQTHGLSPPNRRFVCTVQVARQIWRIHPTKLPDVCRHLRIPLRHHEAASDAEACARIMIAAQAAGWRR